VNVSGVGLSVRIWGADWNLTMSGSIEGLPLTGTLVSKGKYYQNSDTTTNVMSESNQSERYSTDAWSYDGWINNVSTYVPSDEGNQGIPSYVVGAEWSRTSIVHSDVSRSINGSVDSFSFTFLETLNYSVLRREQVNLSWASLDCVVVRVDSIEGTGAYWISSEIGFYAKAVEELRDGETSTWIIKSFSHQPSSDYATGEESLAIGAAVAVVTVLIVVLVARMKFGLHKKGLDLGMESRKGESGRGRRP